MPIPERCDAQPLTRETLRRIADSMASASELADKSGISQSVVSRHLTGHRDIAPDHLAQYLQSIPPTHRVPLLAAWLRDTLPPDVAESVLNARGRIRETVASYQVGPTDATRAALEWLASEASIDRELAAAIRTFAHRMGFGDA